MILHGLLTHSPPTITGPVALTGRHKKRPHAVNILCADYGAKCAPHR
ncbi:MAG: hypothetical protein LBL46_02760 [Rickettsiales bacterium]|nr:hypothetical protein [Rickettsiales bacterium]